VNAGLDPNALPDGDPQAFAKLSQANKDGSSAKAWKDIWGAGQGVGLIKSIPTVAQIVDQIEAEYQSAKQRLQLA
jgi:nitronate monooxygenase